MELTADCSRCFALCCAALPFSASSDFAQAKPAGVPCSNLADDFGCSIHQRLASSGWRGCTVYDCAGAGQQVAQGSYAGVSWRERPDLADEMFAVFRATGRVHELLLLLDLAPTRTKALDELWTSLAALSGAQPDVVLAADLDRWASRVITALGEVSAQARGSQSTSAVALSAKAPGADLIGADLRGQDLRNADLRGALLIAADLRGADVTGADLLGADLRDARVDSGALASALFVTARQRDAVAEQA
ncbi:MAG TPA: pentapeptide repeat-containing protein [Nocardioides sp.]